MTDPARSPNTPLASGPAAGFDDPVLDAQTVFRGALACMARPGTIAPLPTLPQAPAPLNPASAALCLTLLDADTPLFLDAPLAAADPVRAFLQFHCGCPIVDAPNRAAFAVIADAAAMPPLDAFATGDDANPNGSATLVLQVTTLAVAGPGARTLTGPGIDTSATLAAEPVPAGLWLQIEANAKRFPCGVDLVFSATDRLAALPRSTHVAGPPRHEEAA